MLTTPFLFDSVFKLADEKPATNSGRAKTASPTGTTDRVDDFGSRCGFKPTVPIFND